MIGRRPAAAGTVALVVLVLLAWSRREKVAAGVVLDDGTGAPMAAVPVAVQNRGWGRSGGQLVWDKDHVYPAVTDAAGRFRVPYRVGSSVHLIVQQAGYAPHDGWYEAGAPLVVRLKRAAPVAPSRQ